MQRDVVVAQAATLRSMAVDWERDARITPGGGHGEVAFLLRRAARLAETAVGVDGGPDELPETLPNPESVLDVREG